MVVKMENVERDVLNTSSIQMTAKEKRSVATSLGWHVDKPSETGEVSHIAMPVPPRKNEMSQRDYLLSGRTNAMFILLPYLIADGIVKAFSLLQPLDFNFVEYATAGQAQKNVTVQKTSVWKEYADRAVRAVAQPLNALNNWLFQPEYGYLDLLLRKGHAQAVFGGDFLGDLLQGDSFKFYDAVDRDTPANDNVKSGQKGKAAPRAA